MNNGQIDPYLPDAYADRDIAMWRLHCAGHTQQAIARRFDVGQATVSRSIARVRDALPVDERADAVKRELALIYELRAKMVELFETDAPPAFSQKGDALVDPRTGKVVEDASIQFNAFAAIIKTSERVAKMLGLDAPTRVQAEVAQVTYVLVGVDDEAMR